jgi:hypothetical protein
MAGVPEQRNAFIRPLNSGSLRRGGAPSLVCTKATCVALVPRLRDRRPVRPHGRRTSMVPVRRRRVPALNSFAETHELERMPTNGIECLGTMTRSPKRGARNLRHHEVRVARPLRAHHRSIAAEHEISRGRSRIVWNSARASNAPKHGRCRTAPTRNKSGAASVPCGATRVSLCARLPTAVIRGRKEISCVGVTRN